jgi:hypothetical protein
LARKSDIELAKALGVKRIRAAVRLEMACRADAILNDLLDEFYTAFDAQVAAGNPIELTGFQDWVRAGVEERLPLALISGDNA